MASGQKNYRIFFISGLILKLPVKNSLNFRPLRKKGIFIFLRKLFFFSGQAFSDGAHKFF